MFYRYDISTYFKKLKPLLCTYGVGKHQEIYRYIEIWKTQKCLDHRTHILIKKKKHRSSTT